MTIGYVFKCLAVAVAAMALNVAASFGWVAFYSMVIAPGQSEAAYQAYAERAVPWSAVIAGIPILIGASWLLARWQRGGWRTGIGAGVGYAVIDFVILAATGTLEAMPAIVALSGATKIAAAAIGGAIAARGTGKA